MPKTTLKVPLIGTPKVRPRPTRCRANGADCSNLTHPLFLPLFLGRMRESQHAASNGETWSVHVSLMEGLQGSYLSSSHRKYTLFRMLLTVIVTVLTLLYPQTLHLPFSSARASRTRLLRLGCHPARSHTRRRGATSRSRCTVTRSIHEAARRRAGRRGVLFCVMVFLCE